MQPAPENAPIKCCFIMGKLGNDLINQNYRVKCMPVLDPWVERNSEEILSHFFMSNTVLVE